MALSVAIVVRLLSVLFASPHAGNNSLVMFTIGHSYK